ncbi:lipocalin family protein [Xylanibacter muris]|uniref:Lipocalin-like domain-containing protein n=1 Tax=Xylanibacter muris TaxID=2736290 RepID=A0ABX2APP0_9BACT|nr:lipocalin family protein [Xylanibacter muris]NPD92938.1 hypothetical protein [Xylanibacter muris]
MTTEKLFKSILIAASIASAVTSCSDTGNNIRHDNTAIDVHQNEKGDSTLYGLACDGCTDTVAVILPNSGGDPDTINIMSARKNNSVFGKPKIGDRIAIYLNPNDKKTALSLINLDDLTGSWCYQVMPHMRDIASLPQKTQQKILANLPDTMKETLLVPKEMGIRFRRDNLMNTIGDIKTASTKEDLSPVEYPRQKIYKEWRIFNGKLLLTYSQTAYGNDTIESRQANDTVEIKQLTQDTLVLKFKEQTKGYYRK